MFNVTKSLNLLSSLTILGALIASGCSSKDPDTIAAEGLAQSVDSLLNAGDYQLAMELMDTINLKYPNQVQVRKQITAMRPRAIELASIRQIEKTDSLISETELIISELEPKMKHVAVEDLEGYYVVSDGYNPGFINNTGVEPRVNDSNWTYYIVAQTSGKSSLGINQVSLNTAAEEMKSLEMPKSSERSVVIEGSELATFLPEEVNELGSWAAEQDKNIKGAMIYGAKGHQQVKLNEKQAQAFGTAWKYADAKLRHRNALIVREKLDRQLQIARDQIANTTTPAE